MVIESIKFNSFRPALARKLAKNLEYYDIHVCTSTEIDEYQAYIRRHWDKGHIYGTSRALLDWQNFDKESNRYNIALARQRPTGEIHATLAFIPTRHFDDAIEHYDIWFGLTSCKNEIKAQGLASHLVKYVAGLKGARSGAALGLSSAGYRGLKKIGFKMGRLNHYYMVNEEVSSFFLIDRFDGRYRNAPAGVDGQRYLKKLEEQGILGAGSVLNDVSSCLPRKSLTYFRNRYLRHPYYKYDCYGVYDDVTITEILVVREVSHKNAAALRVIDYYGPDNGLTGTASALQRLLRAYEAEYIDFYNYGIDADVMRCTGMLLRGGQEGIIIPNYYEPFERRNVNIYYGYIGAEEGQYKIFKGDSDQDRASILAR
ncbi:hypothetical protein N9H39_09710 [Gammaproteobacteria bacterium]|nr:hypothetical protein [Gammaproteobacteria bacterium]